jgi:hypothetical protein
MTAALEGSEKLESLGSRLDAKSAESHVRQLEKDILTKMQLAKEATAARDVLSQRLDMTTHQLAERTECCRQLEEALSQQCHQAPCCHFRPIRCIDHLRCCCSHIQLSADRH